MLAEKVPQVPPADKAVSSTRTLDRDVDVPGPQSHPAAVRRYLLGEIKAWWSLSQGR